MRVEAHLDRDRAVAAVAAVHEHVDEEVQAAALLDQLRSGRGRAVGKDDAQELALHLLARAAHETERSRGGGNVAVDPHQPTLLSACRPCKAEPLLLLQLKHLATCKVKERVRKTEFISVISSSGCLAGLSIASYNCCMLGLKMDTEERNPEDAAMAAKSTVCYQDPV